MRRSAIGLMVLGSALLASSPGLAKTHRPESTLIFPDLSVLSSDHRREKLVEAEPQSIAEEYQIASRHPFPNLPWYRPHQQASKPNSTSYDKIFAPFVWVVTTSSAWAVNKLMSSLDGVLDRVFQKIYE